MKPENFLRLRGGRKRLWLWCGLALLVVALVASSAEAQPFAYVANAISDNVSVINTATNTEVLPRIPVGTNPFVIAITPDSAFAYVANYSSNNVSVINTATNTEVLPRIPVGAAPLGVAITP